MESPLAMHPVIQKFITFSLEYCAENNKLPSKNILHKSYLGLKKKNDIFIK